MNVRVRFAFIHAVVTAHRWCRSVGCIPYGEEVIYEVVNSVGPMVRKWWAPHRQFNFPSRDFGKDTAGCVAAVLTTIGQGLRGPALYVGA